MKSHHCIVQALAAATLEAKAADAIIARMLGDRTMLLGQTQACDDRDTYSPQFLRRLPRRREFAVGTKCNPGMNAI